MKRWKSTWRFPKSREQTNKYGEYASLSLSTDANNTAAMQLMDRTMQQDVADRMASAAFSRYLGSLSDEAFEQAIAESEQLQAVDFSLRQDRAAAKHLPAPEIQEWLLKNVPDRQPRLLSAAR